MKKEVLRMEAITLGENRQLSLNRFNLTLCEGEVIGVFSHHASVKKHLVGLIAGRLGAQSGRIYIDGEPCPFEEADLNRYRKVGVIQAVSTLVDALSISDNVFVIRKGFRARIIDSRLLDVQTQQLLTEYGLSLDPKALVGKLSGAERCMLEIVKAIVLGARIVMLQDISTFLSDFEISQLMGLVSRLKQKGTGFLMIDSSVVHLQQGADQVAVIRNGRNFWTFKAAEFNEQTVRACFSGETGIGSSGPASVSAENLEKEPVLVFDAVYAGKLRGLSFVLHPGEALCLSDQAGQGIEAVRALLNGSLRPESGRILMEGKPFTARNLWEALDQRIAFVVENPSETMLFPDFTALENLCYPTSRKTPDFWMNPRYLKSCLGEYGPYFGPEVLKQYPDALSAPDLHKLVYCRWHLYSPGVVVCVKPFNAVEKRLEEISAFFIGLLLQKGIAVLILTAHASGAGIPFRKIAVNPKNDPLHLKDAL